MIPHGVADLASMGYRVKLIAAQFVKPYVKGNKSDHLDEAGFNFALAAQNSSRNG